MILIMGQSRSILWRRVRGQGRCSAVLGHLRRVPFARRLGMRSLSARGSRSPLNGAGHFLSSCLCRGSREAYL